MDSKLKEKYDKSIEFWGQAQTSEESDYAGIDKAEDWKQLFEKYFDIEQLEYFKWDVEQTEGRRFFTLSVK